MEKVVASGEWLYDGSAPTPVLVVRLDYDFWHAVGEADGELGPDDAPTLNSEGSAYYVRHKPGWSEGQPFWPDSQGFMTLDEAKAAAQAAVAGPITWR
ncbi:MAG TPA: hypothetical protein VFH54_02250 [Mycobacteriales bacterium]|nr:hypothetical protein [Mycobacteriales bacterium]